MKKFFEESWLVLVMGIAFAVLLAATQSATTPKIEANKARTLNQAIAAVVPGMDPAQEPTEFFVDENKVFACYTETGDVAGYAIRNSGGGFVDMIELVVGLSPDLETITGMQVVTHLETPGLGTKIESKEGHFFPYQFEGKATDQPLIVEKRPAKEPWEVQAITGATWSSRYVTDIVNEVIEDLKPQLREKIAAGI
jgi:electron transport complex protein RnfG